ncbi:MAG: DUF4838 domain-containing protein, partial [Lentisphaeria bacterium]|nr:DUF4838 domain-containing protein [Lentisphaeria bacterium]
HAPGFLTLLACALAAAAPLAPAAPLTLIGDRKNPAIPETEIIIDENCPPAVQFAAEELQHFLLRITGVRLPVNLSAQYAWQTKKVILALPDSPHFAGVRDKYAADLAALAGTDGYAVRTSGNQLFLFADCPKGVLNGVYRFLTRNSDLIWPRPGGELAIFTPSPTFVAAGNDGLDLPKFKMRGFGWNYSRSVHSGELDVWNARQGANLSSPDHPALAFRRRRLGFREGYYDVFEGGHNLIRFWLPVEKYGQEHPEYYMLIEGQRYVKNNANPCVTNPAVVSALAERFREVIPTLPPHYSTIVAQIADQSLCCECDRCRQPITLPDGTVLTHDHEAFRSTQFFLFFNQLARIVHELNPRLMIQQYGYFFLAEPPLVKVEPNVKISFCPYIRNDKKPLSDPSNAKWKRRTDAWLANTPNLIWREYYYSGARFPRPIADIACQDLRYIQARGLTHVTSEFTWSDDGHVPADKMPASEFWDTTAMEAWTMLQLLWDPYQDPQALRAEYLRRTYREAATAMQEYYDLIRTAWLEDDTPSAFNDDVFKSAAYYILGKKIDDACRAALSRAEKDAVHPDSLRLVQANRAVFEQWLARAAEEKLDTVRVPFIRLTPETAPGFDLSAGVWQQAAGLPPLLLMGHAPLKSQYETTIRILQDGRHFLIGCSVRKAPATIWARHPAGTAHDVFPSGDHIELFFSHPRDGYYQLAYDVNGNRYDGRLTDASWNTPVPWEVKTRVDDNGWSSIAKIPFAAVNFEKLVSNKLRFLFFLTNLDDQRKAEHSTWGGGRVHAADSFGELTVDLE